MSSTQKSHEAYKEVGNYRKKSINKSCHKDMRERIKLADKDVKRALFVQERQIKHELKKKWEI